MKTSPPAETSTEAELVDEALKREFAGEIVVTSTRRAEKLQEIPIAVSVVTSDELEDIAASDISVLQQYVPNVSIYQGRNQSTTLTAFIRGVGQSDPLWGVDPGVGLYIDDVYIARAQGALLDVYDVERVEVLRGPQGTLYGKNTIGGAIKYVPKAMSDTPEGRFTLGLGSFNTQEYRFNLSGSASSRASCAARSRRPSSSATATARTSIRTATSRTRTPPHTAPVSSGCRPTRSRCSSTTTTPKTTPSPSD